MTRAEVQSLKAAADLLQTLSQPFLNWAGKAERQQISVPTVPLFVHERHSTKAILDGIKSRKAKGTTLDLFGDGGLDVTDKLDAYEHKGPWQNRMVLGDSLQVMNSMLEFEGLGGQVQMVFIDPPYGVKFGSNFQPFVRKKEVKHGSDDEMTREPEMVKAYRDTWELGLHSYLTYLRDRLMLAKELLNESGSIFIQISDQNVHHLREVLDEVFGTENFVSMIAYTTTSGFTSNRLSRAGDYLIWYAKDISKAKYRQLYSEKANPLDDPKTKYDQIELSNGLRRPLTAEEKRGEVPLPEGSKIFRNGGLDSQGSNGDLQPFGFEGKSYSPAKGRHWTANYPAGMEKLVAAKRISVLGKNLRI